MFVSFGLESQRFWTKDKESSQNDHQGAADKVTPFGVFRSESQMLRSPEGDAEDDEVVHHIEEDVEGHQALAFEPVELVQFDDLGEGLGDTDGAGEFDDVHGKC